MSLPKYIKDTLNLTIQEAQEIGYLFNREVFSKGHFLIQEGGICRQVFLLKKDWFVYTATLTVEKK